jgi:hypothetical protein
MIDNGAAYTTIGNHEYNAICYWAKLQDGTFLRPHSSKNTGQHKDTIASLGDELLDYIEWFKTLPIWFASEKFRVVHAQWKPDYVNYLKSKNVVDFSNQEFLFQSADKTSMEFEAIECLLKGEEVEVPDVPFFDKDKNKRYAYRIKWWLKGESLECKDSLFEFPMHGKSDPIAISGYKESDVPVFFGHYWLKNAKPILMSQNVCCIDFSVAKSGNLVAYRWNGERILDEANFCFVPAIS